MTRESQDEDDQRIVAVGLLTRRELSDLGQQLSRLYPITDDSKFSDLLQAIDRADREHHRQENSGCR